MKTNSEFILREIAGEAVLIPTGEASQNLNGMIHLTETGAFIWKQVDTWRRSRRESGQSLRLMKRRRGVMCADFCMNCISGDWWRISRSLKEI